MEAIYDKILAVEALYFRLDQTGENPETVDKEPLKKTFVGPEISRSIFIAHRWWSLYRTTDVEKYLAINGKQR